MVKSEEMGSGANCTELKFFLFLSVAKSILIKWMLSTDEPRGQETLLRSQGVFTVTLIALYWKLLHLTNSTIFIF